MKKKNRLWAKPYVKSRLISPELWKRVDAILSTFRSETERLGSDSRKL